MKTKTILGWATLALWAASGSGCAAETSSDDDTDSTSELLTIAKPVAVGLGKVRYMDKTCARACVSWGPPISKKPGMPPTRPCIKWGDDCSATPPVVTLRASASDPVSTPFPAYYEGPSWSYQGCGPQAIMNVISYFGRDVPIGSIAPSVFQIDDPTSDNKATPPDSLADALRRLLPQWLPGGTFTVNELHGGLVRDTVRSELLQGNPVIMLVQGGDHLQVVTALSGDLYYVIDYVNKGAWVEEDQLGLDIKVPSVIVKGIWGFEDQTYFTIHRTPCSSASLDTCDAHGAICEHVGTHDMCRWTSATSSNACASTLGIWTWSNDGFAINNPGSVPPGSDGSCITQIENLSCSASDAALCASHGATCERAIASDGATRRDLCRWHHIKSASTCGSPGLWTDASSSFAQGWPTAVPPGWAGACITQVQNLR